MGDAETGGGGGPELELGPAGVSVTGPVLKRLKYVDNDCNNVVNTSKKYFTTRHALTTVYSTISLITRHMLVLP